MPTPPANASAAALPRRLAWGALAGLVGGLVFGLMLTLLGLIGLIGALAGQLGNVPLGWAIHLGVGALLGAGFGLLAPAAGPGLGRLLAAGAAYGLAWWFLGPLLIMPTLLGAGPQLNARAMQEASPSLVGHVVYGVVTASVWYRLARGAEGDAGPPT